MWDKRGITMLGEDLYKVITLSFSCISLIVSILVAWSNRKTLHVEVSKNLEIIDGGTVFVLNDDNIPEPYGDGVLAKIEIVNPSPKDIAFFDLRCFYPETNINASLLTRRTMFDEFRDRTLWRAVKYGEKDVNLMELTIPDKNFGVLKSGSFTRFDILMFPSVNANSLILSFKVAKKAFKKDPFAVTGRRKYKYYGRNFNICLWTEFLSDKTSDGENVEPESTR